MDNVNRPDNRPFFLRRFPEDVRRRLADEARASERSLTAEIIHRLRQSLRATDEAAA
jgi:Arc-like DNA binding domain